MLSKTFLHIITLIETNNQVFWGSCPLLQRVYYYYWAIQASVGPIFVYSCSISHIWEHKFYYLEGLGGGLGSKGSTAVIKYLTMAWIQISCQNWNGFFSNDSHQIII